MRKIGGMITPFASSPTHAPGMGDGSSVDEGSPKRHDTPAVSAGSHSGPTARAAGPGHDRYSATPTQTLLPIASTSLGITPLSVSVSSGSAAASNRTLKHQLPALSSPVAAKRRNSSLVQDFSTTTEVLYSYSGLEGCPGEDTNDAGMRSYCSYCLRVASTVHFSQNRPLGFR
jgi:hypothetical protein